MDPEAQSIILDTDGYLAENKGGNFFVVQDGTLKTPPTWQALAGITRATTIEIAQEKERARRRILHDRHFFSHTRIRAWGLFSMLRYNCR